MSDILLLLAEFKYRAKIWHALCSEQDNPQKGREKKQT